MKNTIKLQTDTILQIPLDKYFKDFTFIVNGKKYQTSKIIADILSPKISNIHQSDFTFSEYTINSKYKGDFNKILGLVQFQQQNFSDLEIPFFTEIIENLCNDKIDINIYKPKLTIKNVIDLIKRHEKLNYFYSSELAKEIDFLCEFFYKLTDSQMKDLLDLEEETIERIISNKKLTLTNEDQLLDFVNELSSLDNRFYMMYEYVYFENVSKTNFENFLGHFEFECLSFGVWRSIINRFLSNSSNDRKYTFHKEIPFEKNSNDLRGIFNYFRTTSEINEEVKISFSSFGGNDPHNLLNINEKTKGFYTSNKPNSWICFEFKKHRIIPNCYTIKSQNNGKNCSHPKSWIIEGSSDSVDWQVIDEQYNTQALNGSFLVSTFPISAPNKEFKYLRIRQTGKACDNSYFFHIGAIEFYGFIV